MTSLLDECLREYEGVPRPQLEAAAEFGKHVHLAHDMDDRGELDYEGLDQRLRPYVDGWRAFKAKTGFLVLASELRVYHPRLGYAGTLDTIGVFPGKRMPVILDRKTSAQVPRSVGPQTAAYLAAYKVETGFSCSPHRYCLHLLPEGGYRLHRLSSARDWTVFLSCLNIWRFKNAA